jgi:8-oxo-dGTP diphosphatase
VSCNDNFELKKNMEKVISKEKWYVLGFAFDSKKENVVLIEKQKPEWQKDKFNGIGGKVELSDSTIHDAMVREFYEETGVVTNVYQWHLFAKMIFGNDVMGGGACVYCFRTFDNAINDCSTCEEEVIEICKLDGVYNKPLMHNLHILIPLALQKEFGYTELNQ